MNILRQRTFKETESGQIVQRFNEIVMIVCLKKTVETDSGQGRTRMLLGT